jgi:queuine tRNA-ribosyltransferase
MEEFKFEIIHKSKKSNAKVARIHTPHGIIDTPNFVAVGTNGTLKALDNEMVKQIGLQLMFCNTYHLLLQPGTNLIKQAGGIHKYINRVGPIITDSGGFQVFSLAYGSIGDELKKKTIKKETSSILKITEEGVIFRSYRDGKKIHLTPETSIQAQKDIGADIIIPLDELLPYHTSLKELQYCLDRTHRWEERSLNEHLKNKQNQAIYAVIHGGINTDLRKKSCSFLTSLPFDGYAIGGSIGKNKEEMLDILSYTVKHLPENQPKHLLGIGDISSFEMCIPLGIDTFDSSYPTKAARHGLILTNRGPIKIKQNKYANDFSPIDKECSCFTCTHYSRGYIQHLFKANELTAYLLSTIHNLHFIIVTMQQYRQKILDDEI